MGNDYLTMPFDAIQLRHIKAAEERRNQSSLNKQEIVGEALRN
jgi:hypothetical protein